jgi:hypothetical protein
MRRYLCLTLLLSVGILFVPACNNDKKDKNKAPATSVQMIKKDEHKEPPVSKKEKKNEVVFFIQYATAKSPYGKEKKIEVWSGNKESQIHKLILGSSEQDPFIHLKYEINTGKSDYLKVKITYDSGKEFAGIFKVEKYGLFSLEPILEKEFDSELNKIKGSPGFDAIYTRKVEGISGRIFRNNLSLQK